MAFDWKVLIWLGIFCGQYVHYTSGATTPVGALTARKIRHLPQNKGYLPPFSSTNYDDKTQSASTYISHAAQSIDAFETRPRISTKRPRTSYQHFRIHSSYAPPASGAASFEYSRPQASNLVPLPSLMPKSVVDEVAKATTLQQQLQQEQQSAPSYAQQPEAPIINAPFLMIEEPAAMFLSSAQNDTLQAARILASTLLEANGEPPLAPLSNVPLVNPSGHSNLNELNSTDVVIVKAQKNAYIIPTHLAKDVRNPANARELYQMRDQLEKAYTINQFIFIIKPERINFLNKLV